MKKTFLRSAVIALAGVGLMAGSAFALGFPFADFQGSVSVDLDGTLPTLNTVHTTGYMDIGGNYVTDPSVDSFVGQSVSASLFSGINYDFTTDTLTIDPSATAQFAIGSSADLYLTAVASNISATKWGQGVYSITASLSDQQYYHTADSTFMAQYEASSPDSGIQGELITWDLVFTMPQSSGYEYAINVSGKMAPVPEPATMLLFGTGLAGLAGVVRKKKKQ